jgi:DNA-binding MarR family transcriptional regulator
MDDDLGILLLLAYQSFVRALHRDLAEHGIESLRPSDGYVFRALAEEPRRIVDLADGLEVTKQAASQIVADMESRELVRRRPDPTDGRASLVELTARGRRALATARRFHSRFEADLADQLGPRRAATLRSCLESIVAAELEPDERAGLIRLP